MREKTKGVIMRDFDFDGLIDNEFVEVANLKVGNTVDLFVRVFSEPDNNGVRSLRILGTVRSLVVVDHGTDKCVRLTIDGVYLEIWEHLGVSYIWMP